MVEKECLVITTAIMLFIVHINMSTTQASKQAAWLTWFNGNGKVNHRHLHNIYMRYKV